MSPPGVEPSPLALFFSFARPALLVLKEKAMEIPAPYLMPWMIREKMRRLPEILWRGNLRKPLVALTFDDGPSRFTPGLLDLLDDQGVKASFFLLGNRVSLYPKTVQEAYRKGHTIGIHGYWHRKFTGLEKEKIERDLERCREELQALLGPHVKILYFRPPHGACDRRVLQVAHGMGLRVVLCSILPGQQLLPRGWKEEPSLTEKRVIRDLEPGAIIALHDGERLRNWELVFDADQIVATVARLIPAIRSRGYEFATLEDLAGG
jgi:peptidoglycan/xylan/chitin deacetylase (PgdA/CDA1 family)